jgi:N-[(2S)-2-amino-2-carboxyethyl]-L-glutamate dehydrogenase
MALDRILYLKTEDVRTACAALNPVATTREVLKSHATGEAIVPNESYLSWVPDEVAAPGAVANGEPRGFARSLGMPGIVVGPRPIVGTKIINASSVNGSAGHPRASGLTILFDPYTARPVCILEAALISALRTASVTIVAVQLLHTGPIATAALVGAGAQAHAHLELFLSYLPGLKEVRVFDRDPHRADVLCESYTAMASASDVKLAIVSDPQKAIEDAEVVVAVTTTTEGYIPFRWLSPGTTLVSVSLDDPLPDVVFNAHVLVIDDWQLITADTRRLLGRLYRDGLVCGPEIAPGEGMRKVDATIGDLILGRHPGRRDPGDVVLVNTFGLAIEDLAIAQLAYERAVSTGLGTWLPFET